MSGSQPRQTFADDPVGGEIRLRYRRSVELAVDLHRRAVDGENSRAGPDHQFGQRLHQRGCGIAIDHRSRRTCLIHERFPGQLLGISRAGLIYSSVFPVEPPLLAARASAVYQASKHA